MCECKVCNKLKVRQDGGKRSGCSGLYKVDGTGRRWNGLTCPDCRSAQVGVRKSEKLADFGPPDVLYPPKLHACRNCKTMNPNYYECNPCRSTKSQYGCYENDMFEYHNGANSGGNTAGRRANGWAY